MPNTPCLDRRMSVGLIFALRGLAVRGSQQRRAVGPLLAGDLEQGGAIGEVALLGPHRGQHRLAQRRDVAAALAVRDHHAGGERLVHRKVLRVKVERDAR